MRIACWNVNSIRAREDRLLAWLDRQQPDLLCLQETKVTDDELPAGPLEEAGYHVAHFGQKGYNGVALLARQPIEEPARGFGDPAMDDQARLIAGTVAGVRVISVYVPNGKSVGSDAYQYKLRWLDRLRTWLDQECDPDAPLALCGDFNVAPEERDVWNPRAYDLMTTDLERAALDKVLGFGLRDVVRAHRDEDGLYSWWDYRRLAFQKGRGVRIDHIFATPALADRSTDAFVDRDERKGKLPSDHAPVVADFED
jgi:exodeoxyribonuclease-3